MNDNESVYSMVSDKSSFSKVTLNTNALGITVNKINKYLI